MDIKTIAEELMTTLDEEMISEVTGDYSPNASQVAQTLITLSKVILIGRHDEFGQQVAGLMEELSWIVLQDAKERDTLNVQASIQKDLWNEGEPLDVM